MYRLFLMVGMSLLIGLTPLNSFAFSLKQDSEKEEITIFLSQLFKDRNAFLINQQPKTIEKYYNQSELASRYAFQLELKRAKYLNAWADKRGLRLIAAEPRIRIARLKQNGDIVKVSLVESTKISYDYKMSHLPPQAFGVGTRHALTLKKESGGWIVKKEWYLDPLEENPDLIPDSPAGFPHLSAAIDTPRGKGRYKRERAVAYADKYAGLAWGAGNNNRYNRKYMDYTGVGGDCTNFTSQVLGDAKEGGGLRMIGGWSYWGGGGSRSWVQTDAFKHFLLYSGYGRLIAQGTFTEITQSSEKHPDGAIAKLLPGDVIGYVINGDTDHFSIVVGQDANGYPLVNSHTVDRYHVPFDLGWDKNTKYLLIHIND